MENFYIIEAVGLSWSETSRKYSDIEKVKKAVFGYVERGARVVEVFKYANDYDYNIIAFYRIENFSIKK
ncbi:MAG: hypothetical protein IKU25_05190 [Clostridia bacterium]|nr:hypothetical protein [Clostridia bacterium]